jgi:hypothetical protein
MYLIHKQTKLVRTNNNVRGDINAFSINERKGCQQEKRSSSEGVS